ncbi:MAG: DUF2877 domain-containing protein [Thermoleophilia bacterium]|jgi:hypothetical protein|nr:DUF2877 domain-containing protein [Thermoleophilia bacterium]
MRRAPLQVLEAGVGAMGTTGGRVLAAGAGWAWVRDGARPLHVTGERGPRGPLTAVVGRVPVVEPGDLLRLDAAGARAWRTPPPCAPAPAGRIADACAAVRAHAWNEPRALALARRPLAECAAELAGRGPGLTPAGDDALLGYLVGAAAVDPAGARGRAAVVLVRARRATGGPALWLLRMAARGEAPEPAAAMRDVLLAADGAALGPAVRRLTALGRSTGRAMLTGLICALVPEPTR